MPRPTLRLNDGYKHTSSHLKNDVKELQRLLNKKGFSLKVDGFFGRDTENAVLKFQKNNNLVEDGIAGRNTWSALLKTIRRTKKLSLRQLILQKINHF